jgi:predicted NBD/HSP70 family sugar kinase
MLTQAPLPARQASLREHNLALVLTWVADRGPASRARIAAGTGLTKASVSSLVDQLLEAGLLDETPGRPSGAAGRPGLELALADRGPVGFGLEINVDYLTAAAVGLDGVVLHRETIRRDLRSTGPDRVLAEAAGLLCRVVGDAGDRPRAGACVAVPGLVDRDTSVLRSAPNLGWQEVDVLAPLAARPELAGLDLRLGNEANLAALGELWFGVARGLTGFVQVSGEIGVGAGVVLDGRLFDGSRGYGGELGHLPVRSGGPICRCGSTGCLEQVAGQEAILRQAGVGSAEELLAQLAAGRRRPVLAVQQAGSHLGVGLAAMLNVLDLGTVVLGGGYAALAPWLAGPVQQELAARVISAAWLPVRLLVSELGLQAAVRGAAGSVVRRVISHPAGQLAGLHAGARH